MQIRQRTVGTKPESIWWKIR